MRFVCIPRKAVRAVRLYPQESGACGSFVSPGKRCVRFVFIPRKVVRAVGLNPRESGACSLFVSPGKRCVRFVIIPRKAVRTVRVYLQESGARGSFLSPVKRCVRFVCIRGKGVRTFRLYPQENVRKLINAKYCKQFAHTKWKDGTLVHVHITAERHRTFEKKMKTTLDAIQQRCFSFGGQSLV